jgi:DNA-binding response OmpR family regulator
MGGNALQITELSLGEDLPRVQNKKRNTSSQPASTQSSIPSETLLFVEPDVLVRAPISEYLRECGYRVIEVNSIEAAQTILLGVDSKVDVLLVEVSHLGAAEGFAFAKQIRESHSNIDVILTSSIAHCANKAEDLCEADGMLGKPYHSAELLRRIQVLRERRRSRKPSL